MKNFIFIISLFGCQLLFDQNKEEKSVLNTLQILKNAMVDADESTLNQIIADNLSYGHSSGKVETKKELIGSLLSGDSDFVSIDFSNQSINITKNLAIVRHRLDAVTNNKNVKGTVKLDVLLVLQKQKNRWILVARQAVKVA